MDLNFNMSSLRISANKRRVSGLLGTAPPPGNESPNKDYTLSPHSPTSTADLPLEYSSNNTSIFDEDTAITPDSSPTQLDMGKVDPTQEVRRSSRRKSVINLQPCSSTISKTKSSLVLDLIKDKKKLEKIYTNKHVGKPTQSLETIFETPAEEKLMSKQKFRRFINFKDLQKNKIRKVPFKSKGAVASYNKMKRKNKITMNAFMQKLQDLESD